MRASTDDRERERERERERWGRWKDRQTDGKRQRDVLMKHVIVV